MLCSLRTDQELIQTYETILRTKGSYMCMSITRGRGEEVPPRLLIQQKIYLSVLSLSLSPDCVLLVWPYPH